MLLEAHHLTRSYGRFRAVDDVSFGIERGEIVGLLGPNGAGKSTTMRMLTGFLPPTSGKALVAGVDAHTAPRSAARHIGYMPENNPLYPQMRVREFLAFRAELKGLARGTRRRRIRRCMEMCRVDDVAGQIIGTLSKGYRQRVGLADAMLAKPDVLILDEPTIGLDPNQVRETRALIAGLAEHHTVLVSTHILAEVEAVCQRVLIIVAGRLAADDTPAGLAAKTLRSQIVAEMQVKAGDAIAALRKLDGVQNVSAESHQGWQRFQITPRSGADPRAAIARLAAERHWPLRELVSVRPSLEDVFRKVTTTLQEDGR
jgi:gliding motility-associated transport system ATP-binding protein